MTDWNRLVREQGPTVFGTAWRILGHAADTEDVVQEVFLEVHRLWQGRRVRHWPALLRRLAACRALDRLRQRKAYLPLENADLIAAMPGPEEIALEHELAVRLRAALGQLPTREAEVFCLRYFDELSYQQIAESLDISSGAVATALNKARGKLEAMLTQVAKGE